jgi:hypothetical protein
MGRLILNKRYLSLAAAAGLVLTGVAKADFIIIGSRTAGTGMFAGDDVVQWKVQNSGTGTTAGTTKLLALDVAMTGVDLVVHRTSNDG